jgi:hypothetical protein
LDVYSIAANSKITEPNSHAKKSLAVITST